MPTRSPLAHALLPVDAADQTVHRVGTVSNTSPVEVDVGGATGLTASHLHSYTPTGGQVVLILQTRTDLIILGHIHSGP